MLDQDYLKSILEYDPSSGAFRWKWRSDVANNVNGRFCGAIAGKVKPGGYWAIMIDYKLYYAHHLAWCFVHGEWAVEIDHKDGNPSNNRINNLRLATRSQNAANTYMLNRGVEQRGSRYRAVIQVEGQRHRLGTFATKEEAQLAYNVAADKFFGEFARCNRA